MEIPFTSEQFFGVMEMYNSDVFPAQIIILALGILSFLLIGSKHPHKNAMIGGFLGVLWLWTGIEYHIFNFSSINPAAYVFGGIFVVQGFLFLTETFLTKRLEFEFHHRAADYAGCFFILFGLIIYPIIIYLMKKSFPMVISLGLPCPSTMLTFGVLMLTSRKFPKYLLIIPFLWAIIATSAASLFQVYPDYILSISALVASVYLVIRKRENLMVEYS